MPNVLTPWSSRRQPRLGRAITEARVMDVLHAGPASRAAISRSTGLSKPTVSAVVRDLEEAGLVRLHGRAAGGVGRSSTLYEVNPAAAFGLGFDIGGTNIRATVTDLFGVALAEITEPTRREDADGLLGQLAALHEGLLRSAAVARETVLAAGVSVPGAIDAESDTITGSFNVPALASMRPQRDLASALGLPVVVANDVNLAAAGEQWRGSAVGVNDFVAISIGTGVGAGIVSNGAIQVGCRGAAGEIGLMPLCPGAVDLEGMTGGPLEDAVSGPALERRLLDAIASGRATAMSSAADLPALFAAAAAGDPLAVELVDREAEIVAFAIAGVVALVDPALIVLGGGVGSNPTLLEPVRRHLAATVPEPPPVVTSSLGGRASLWGAIAVALNAVRDQLLGDVRRIRDPRRDGDGLNRHRSRDDARHLEEAFG